MKLSLDFQSAPLIGKLSKLDQRRASASCEINTSADRHRNTMKKPYPQVFYASSVLSSPTFLASNSLANDHAE